MLEIWKVRVRDALAPRREPYWGPPLGEGKSLGLRKIDAAQSRWIAKLRNESGHHSEVLGNLTDWASKTILVKFLMSLALPVSV